MSQGQVISDADIIGMAQYDMYNSLVASAVSALVFYEYLLTISVEWRLVWRKRWTGMTWVFVMTRYLMLPSAVFNLLSLSPSPSSCTTLVWGLNFIAIILPLLLTTAFSALRVYAISGRGLCVTALVLALNLVPVVINSWKYSRDAYGYVNDPLLGPSCTFRQSVSPSNFFHLSLACRTASILADAIVIFVTWSKTFSNIRLAYQADIVSVSATLLRDGSIYFLALLGMNVGVVIANANPSFAFASAAEFIFITLPSVLICRFLMNLREAISPPVETTMESFSNFAPLNFHVPLLNNIVGNLGEDLDHGPQSDYSEETDRLDVIYERGLIEIGDDSERDNVPEACHESAV